MFGVLVEAASTPTNEATSSLDIVREAVEGLREV